MKWITTDYKGNKKVWYSEDIIQRIDKLAKEYCKQKIHDPDIDKIVELIKCED